MSFFFVNKSYYLRIFFNLNNISYNIIRKRFGVAKVEDIIRAMQNILKIIQNQFKKTQKAIS